MCLLGVESSDPLKNKREIFGILLPGNFGETFSVRKKEHIKFHSVGRRK